MATVTSISKAKTVKAETKPEAAQAAQAAQADPTDKQEQEQQDTEDNKGADALTGSQAIKLIARILNKNPDNSGPAVIEGIRDVVSATGWDASYEGQASGN